MFNNKLAQYKFELVESIFDLADCYENGIKMNLAWLMNYIPKEHKEKAKEEVNEILRQVDRMHNHMCEQAFKREYKNL